MPKVIQRHVIPLHTRLRTSAPEMRAMSHEQARLVAAQSAAAIDQYHKAFQRESWAEVVALELLLDLKQDAA